MKCDLQITYYEAITHAVQIKLIDRVAQKRGVITIQYICVEVIGKEVTEIAKAKKALD